MGSANVPRDMSGHTAVKHGDHVDYLDHGRLLHVQDGKVEEHTLAATSTNPDRCMVEHRSFAAPGHAHGPGCGHEAVPHAGHVDYLVDGRLQHPHGDHIDDHGPLSLA